jgi:hypothetical protein
MTEKPHKTGPAWAEFSHYAPESVEIVLIAAIEPLCSAT